MLRLPTYCAWTPLVERFAATLREVLWSSGIKKDAPKERGEPYSFFCS
jgi:hypothetical protein